MKYSQGIYKKYILLKIIYFAFHIIIIIVLKFGILYYYIILLCLLKLHVSWSLISYVTWQQFIQDSKD